MNSQRSQRHYSSTTSEQKLDFMIINGNINKNKITAYCTSCISSLTRPWKFLLQPISRPKFSLAFKTADVSQEAVYSEMKWFPAKKKQAFNLKTR